MLIFDVHSSTVLLQTLLKSASKATEPVCYVHIGQRQMDIVVLDRKQLKFHNSFNFETREDFIYYILFTLEQLELDPESVPVRLFGYVEEGDELYGICYEFIRHISIFVQENDLTATEEVSESVMDFTLLNA